MGVANASALSKLASAAPARARATAQALKLAASFSVTVDLDMPRRVLTRAEAGQADSESASPALTIMIHAS